MNKKAYKKLSVLINEKIEDTYKYFEEYKHLFKNNAQEVKAGSYGGRDVLEFVEDFNKEVNKKCNELLKEIDSLFINSGRKLSNNQYADLIDKCTTLFASTIDGYYKVFEEEFDLNETIETSSNLFRGNTALKISRHINALNIMSNTKLDKALLWTAIGTVFAGLSLVLSVIAIIVTI
ncbi:MAG: hypothetical protein E7526_07170 [Ruminococcaceae bacterium]|nr:hypothetical protein [Oscillospiraceae bacterium]